MKALPIFFAAQLFKSEQMTLFSESSFLAEGHGGNVSKPHASWIIAMYCNKLTNTGMRTCMMFDLWRADHGFYS